MENQCGQENRDICQCPCHPGTGAGGCAGCAHMHGHSKMGSGDAFELVWQCGTKRRLQHIRN